MKLLKRYAGAFVLLIAIVLMTSACRFGDVTVTILQTSDVHHHASGYGPFLDYTPLNTADKDEVLGGYARLAALIKDIRKEQAAKHVPVLLFDSGDFLMGTVYDLTANDPIALKFFSQAGYDAITLGNHEFDWSPSGLAMLLSNGAAGGFRVPVVASNMVVPPDNVLQGLLTSGIIVNKKIIELPYGARIGILGLMGEDSDEKAPVAKPVTFNHDYASIQQQVDDLRTKDCAQVVIALSHGGVEKDGTGNDADLAENVKGIDIIASGHYHTPTNQALVKGDSNTIIFSPGEYGEYLSRLDVTYNIFLRKVVDYKFTLIPVNDTIKGDGATQAMVEAYHGAINTGLTPLGVKLADPVSKTGFPLELASLEESSLGNLAADSLRAVANSLAPYNDGNPYDMSVVASGVIRDNLYPGNTGKITFADTYGVLPLGISPDTSQGVPGYPLMSMYANAREIYTICEVSLSYAPQMGSDYYLNFSGIKIDYAASGVQGVYLCKPEDIFCTSPGTFLNPYTDTGLYHIVVDLYALQMLYVVNNMLPPEMAIIPKDAAGDPITDVMGCRIDRDPQTAGVQELKEWMALLSFISNPVLFPAGIDEALYGPDGLAMGRIY